MADIYVCAKLGRGIHSNFWTWKFGGRIKKVETLVIDLFSFMHASKLNLRKYFIMSQIHRINRNVFFIIQSEMSLNISSDY